MRLLVTGSRHWDDGEYARLMMRIHTFNAAGPITVVHGANKRWDKERKRWTGFDFHCAKAAKEMGWGHEPHPADWDGLGKAAGPARNQVMVDSGVDLCLAAPLVGSVGTWDCVRRAWDAGVPVVFVRRIGADWRDDATCDP